MGKQSSMRKIVTRLVPFILLIHCERRGDKTVISIVLYCPGTDIDINEVFMQGDECAHARLVRRFIEVQFGEVSNDRKPY